MAKLTERVPDIAQQVLHEPSPKFEFGRGLKNQPLPHLPYYEALRTVNECSRTFDEPRDCLTALQSAVASAFPLPTIQALDCPKRVWFFYMPHKSVCGHAPCSRAVLA